MIVLTNLHEPPKAQNHILWGYQPHFCISVSASAKSIFRILEPKLDPKLFLVAININPSNKKALSIVEPHETTPAIFDRVLNSTMERLSLNTGPQVLYEQGNASQKEWARLETDRAHRNQIGNTVKETIESSGYFENRMIYVSAGRVFESFVVYTVLTISKDVHRSHPQLWIKEIDGINYPVSLIDEVAHEFLQECAKSILDSFEGNGWAGEVKDPEFHLKQAARMLMLSPYGRCGGMPYGGFELCNELSAMTYERKQGLGRMIIAASGHESVSVSIRFQKPISKNNYRAIRKVIELAGDEAVLCDSTTVFGIGDIRKHYDSTREDLFVVEFLGHAKWRLMHAGTPLMIVEHGVPKFDFRREQIRKLTETATRLFKDVTPRHIEEIKSLGGDAQGLTRGTIIVIHKDAKREISRFGNHCFAIEPTPLTGALLEKASRVDGAILVDLSCTCYGFGMILDGKVTLKGNSARGARYNSAVRYTIAQKGKCICLIISDDGMIDILPEYRPMVSRNEIVELIENLKEITSAEVLDTHQYNASLHKLDTYRFYVDEKQAKVINKCLSVAQKKERTSGLLMIPQDVRPDSDMDESYFRD